MKLFSLEELQEIFMDYLNKKSFVSDPVNLYDPVAYIMSLGGKTLRPIMTLMSYNLYKEDVSTALSAALSIEIFHNFSLVHDDIMDQAPLRRGQPTVHHKWDVNTGILSGDVMLVKAYQALINSQPTKAYEIVTAFNKAAIEVCEGQQLDMDFEKREDVKIDEYIQMIHFKTASLLGGAITIGAILADAPKADIQHLLEFAIKTGIAFQIQDDILDTYGDPLLFGKKVGGDICQSKKTFLVLKAYEKASYDDRLKLLNYLSMNSIADDEKIQLVKSIFDKYDVRQEAETYMATLLEEGLNHLEEVEVQEDRKEILSSFANQLIVRNV